VEALTWVLYYLQKEKKELDRVYFLHGGNLVPGEMKGAFCLGKGHLIVGDKGESNIPVKDFTVAMQDEAEKPLHHMGRFAVGY